MACLIGTGGDEKYLRREGRKEGRIVFKGIKDQPIELLNSDVK